MARPIKIGLDYFPLDTGMDEKVELLEAKHGVLGFGVLIKLYQKVYREHGYFYPWGEREQLLFCKWINVDINSVNAIIKDAIEYGLFDAEMFKKGILTSTGIQKRFIEASKRRHELTMFSDLLLVNANIIPVNVGNNPRTVELLQYFVCNNPQIKGNKTKVNKSIVENEVTASNNSMPQAATVEPFQVVIPETPKPESKAVAVVDPNYNMIKDAFEKVNGDFTNYAKEGKAIKTIIKLTHGDTPAIQAMIKTFFNLRKTGSNYWKSMPFTPSRLASSGVWDGVKVEAMKSINAKDVSWVDALEKQEATA